MFFVFKVNDFKAGLENIRERRKSMKRGKKKMGKVGKSGNEQKYQFQKYPYNVHLHFFSAARAW